MSTMIKLKLLASQADLDSVRKLRGLSDLEIDSSFGLLLIDPKASLYVIRVAAVDRLDYRRSLSPEIIEAYGDLRISPF